MVICHPHLTSQLLYYQAEISQLAMLYSFKQWYLYDWDFRTRIANDNISRWDYYDTELRAKYLVAPSLSQGSSNYTCWSCNQPGHLANQCNNAKQPYKASSFSPSTNSSPNPPSFAPRLNQPFPAPQRENHPRNANSQLLLGNKQQAQRRQCMYWNQDRGCINPQCKFEHKCSECHQHGHGAQHCRHR